MGLLAFTYLLTVKDVHAWTRPPHWRTVLWAGGGGAFAGYGVYVYRRDHAIFSLIFTAQCLLAGLLAFDAGKALAVPRGTWFAFLGLILTGKVIWEYERHLYRTDACPATATDPRFWCHALWHVFSAAAHHAAMVYHGDLWVAWDSKRRK